MAGGGKRPILEIPVNDAAFQRLFERMGEYQDMLEGLGDKWKQQDESVGALAATMLMVTAALETQRELMSEQAAHTKELQDAEKEKAKRQQEQTRAEELAERRRKQAVADTLKIARNIKDATLDLAKWTFMGGAASAIGGAASLWGLDSAANWVGGQRRAAMGFGVSIGQRQAMQARFSRDFGVDAALEGVSNAQMDPSKAYAFAGLGINPNGQDPATLTIEAAEAIRRVLGSVPKQSQLAMAGALGVGELGFSPDDIKRLLGEPKGDFERRAAEYRQDTGPGGKLRLAADAAEKWQDLVSELEIKTLSVLDPLITKLSSPEIQDSLKTIIDQFGALAGEVLDRIDFHVLGEGLKTFSDYISSKDFQDDFKKFVDNLSLVADEIMAVAVRLKWLLPDKSPESAAATAAGNAAAKVSASAGVGNPWLTGLMVGGATRLFLDRERKHEFSVGSRVYAPSLHTLRDWGIRDSGGSTDATGGGALGGGPVAPGRPGNGALDPVTAAEIAGVRHFMAMGWPKYAAEGWIAQEYGESSMNPHPVGGDGGRAKGAFQWHDEGGILRQTRFNAWAAAHGLADLDHASRFEQEQYASYEALNTPAYAAMVKKMFAAKSPREAAEAGVTFEGPADAAGARRDRGARAMKLDVTVSTGVGQSTAAIVNALAPAS